MFGVVEPMAPGEFQVDPKSSPTFKLGTTVVLETVRGGVPVVVILII